MGAVRHIQKDAADLGILLPNHDHFVRRLNKTHGVERKQEKTGHARGITAQIGRERKFAGQHIRILLTQPLHDPGLKNRVVQVGDPERRLFTGPGRVGIRHIRMVRIIRDGTGTGRWLHEVGAKTHAGSDPSNTGIGRKIRNGLRIGGDGGGG